MSLSHQLALHVRRLCISFTFIILIGKRRSRSSSLRSPSLDFALFFWMPPDSGVLSAPCRLLARKRERLVHSQMFAQHPSGCAGHRALLAGFSLTLITCPSSAFGAKLFMQSPAIAHSMSKSCSYLRKASRLSYGTSPFYGRTAFRVLKCVLRGALPIIRVSYCTHTQPAQ